MVSPISGGPGANPPHFLKYVFGGYFFMFYFVLAVFFNVFLEVIFFYVLFFCGVAVPPLYLKI